MALTLRQTVDYYVNLLLAQYRGAEKARANIAIYAKQAIFDMFELAVQNGFDVDTAAGAQLDILGKYVGIPRNIGDPADKPYYGFSDYNLAAPQNPNGFTDYTNALINASAIWYDYIFQGQENTALPDASYRLMIQLKIILNSNDGTLASVQAFLKEFFDGLVTVVDNKNMTVSYFVGLSPTLPRNVIKAYLPKPMGVRVIFPILSVTVAPPFLSKVEHSGGPATVFTDDPGVATPANGVGPYTYLWQFLGGDPAVVPVNSFAASTLFAAIMTVGQIKFGLYQCKVTDALGSTAVSNPIQIGLALIP